MNLRPSQSRSHVQKQAMRKIQTLMKMRGQLTENLGFSRIDHDRDARKGFPEVIFGPGKTPTQILTIAGKILARSGRLLVTRVDEPTFHLLHSKHPFLKYSAQARAIFYTGSPDLKKRHQLRRGHVLVVCAGTGDIPVAEEAALTARLLGCRVKTIHDVGVAGLHRLLTQLPKLKRASVIVAVAGMEGTMPGVVAGLVNKPVIGVPTSIGYGSSMQGMAALLALLNSCASGLTVVNIDNGFGAGFAAAQILRLAQKKASSQRISRSRPLRPSKPKS